MIKNLISCALIFISLVLLSEVCSATILVVDDFDGGVFYNNVGGGAGVSNNKGNPGEFCNGEMVLDEKTGTGNLFLQLTYHINFIQNTCGESDNFTGYWSKLNDLDVSDYSYLTLYVKGDKKAGYPKAFWVELENADGASRIQVKEITGEWQKFKIPLEEFPDFEDKTKLSEFRIIFDETGSVDKDKGVVYIDNIAFEQ